MTLCLECTKTCHCAAEVDSRSTAISADVPATNGLLHVVDTVLLPSGMAPKTR